VSRRIALGSALLVVALGAEAASNVVNLDGTPQPGFDYYETQDTYGQAQALLSPPATSNHMKRPLEWANGDSDHTAFSQDSRNVRLVAFDSEASNLGIADHNRVRDVYVWRRAFGAGNLRGRLLLASVSSGGAAANGPSSRPALDGEGDIRPHCVVFESLATNLDRRDRSADSDIYLRDIRAGRTTLMSAYRRDAHNAIVDGRCESVTFESRGAVFVASVRSGRVFRLTLGSDPDQQTNGEGVVYVREGQIRHRAFHLNQRGTRIDVVRERLVSDTPTARPGNGVSSAPVVDDQGFYAAFESTSTNLCGPRRCPGAPRDVNGRGSTIFRRTLSRHAPTKDTMWMLDGNGEAHSPAMSAAGEAIAFIGSGERPYYRDGVQKRVPVRGVGRWLISRRLHRDRAGKQFRTGCIVYCAEMSSNPSISAHGNYIAFTEHMEEFCVAERPRGFPGDRDCPAFTDAFIRFIGGSHEGRPLR
jgi:hypothetical protein